MLNMEVYTAHHYLENTYAYPSDPDLDAADYLRVNTWTDLELDKYDTESTTTLI